MRSGRRVLDAVDLDVVAGEVLALVGPNGAGKIGTPRDVFDAARLTRVYGHPVDVFDHPDNGALVVLPVRGRPPH